MSKVLKQLHVAFTFVKSECISNETTSWVVVFLPGGDAKAVEVHHTNHRRSYEVTLEANDQTLKKLYIGFFWFVGQWDRETKVTSSSFQCCGYVPLTKALFKVPGPQTAKSFFQQNPSLCTFPLRYPVPQFAQHHIADIRVFARITPEHGMADFLQGLLECFRADPPMQPPLLDEYNDKTRRWMAKHYPREKQNAYSEDKQLPLLHTAIEMPAPGGTRTVPMWSFTLPAHTQDFESAEHAPFLKRLLELAVFRLGLPKILIEPPRSSGFCASHASHLPTLLEIACEAATLLSCSMVYRLDEINHRAVDVWTMPGMHPDMAHSGGDCDDLQELTLRIILQLQKNPHVKTGEDGLADYLRYQLSKYEFCNCLGTLRISPKQVVWHSFVMGFDREWLLSLGETPPKVRPLLLESTAYLTSCRQFKSPLCAVSEIVYEQMEHQLDSACAYSKVDSNNLQIDAQHLHLHVAFVPQWAKHHQMAELFFIEKNTEQMGIAITPFLHQEDGYKNVEMVCPVPVGPEEHKQALEIYEWMPPCRPFPSLAPEFNTAAKLPWDERDRFSQELTPTVYYFTSNLKLAHEMAACRRELRRYLSELQKTTGLLNVYEKRLCMFQDWYTDFVILRLPIASVPSRKHAGTL